MRGFAKGIVLGSIVGVAIGAMSDESSLWMRKNVKRKGKHMIRKASRLMDNVSRMM